MSKTKERLILHPTDTAQWHALVNEAQVAREAVLSEDLQSYLVFLLMRFCQQPELLNSVIAIDFLESINKLGKPRVEQLKCVGDKCLLLSGLFPGMAERRQVKPSYFVGMGQSAYSSVSNLGANMEADLYGELCERFVVLMDILQTMNQVAELGLSPLSKVELWEETGSQASVETLIDDFQATTIQPITTTKKQSH